MTSTDNWFKPPLDVVAVEFHDRTRGFSPVYRIAVTFRDGHVQLTDTRPGPLNDVASNFAAAIPEAIAQRRQDLALQAQYDRLRSQWSKQLGCTHPRTKAIEPHPLNHQATVECLDCGALKGPLPNGGSHWRHVFVGSSECPASAAYVPAQPEPKRYTKDDIEDLKWATVAGVENPFGDKVSVWVRMKDGKEFRSAFTPIQGERLGPAAATEALRAANVVAAVG